ncbi:MAG: hypothetical protein FWE35_01010 [Streptosporangiales bacterium]|nr:hypothetical protein [Streptosporangiales bacterium]
MPSSTPHQPALAARLAALEAERLAPVPRATHAVAVDVDDLALLADYAAAAVAASTAKTPMPEMSGDTAIAWQHIESTVQAHAHSGA